MICRAAIVGNAAFISRIVVTSWRDASRDLLPWSFLATLDENPHHTPQSWKDRITEPSSVAWIISSETRDAVGVLRVRIGNSSVPETNSELTTPYLPRTHL
jgi:hypothetical protein